MEITLEYYNTSIMSNHNSKHNVVIASLYQINFYQCSEFNLTYNSQKSLNAIFSILFLSRNTEYTF